MSDLRNPFRLRASENIETTALFLRLFSPETLAVFDEASDWSAIRFIRSAPGGGKTSLFRLLAPSTLLELGGLTSQEKYQDLSRRLQGIGVLSQAGGLQVLGVFLSCQEGGFASLEDLPVSAPHRLRLFFSLLNARTILSALRSSLSAAGLPFPEGLPLLTLPAGAFADSPLSLACDREIRADSLYQWASENEQRIYGALDSFVPPSEGELPGHDRLVDLSFLQLLRVDGKTPLAGMSLVLMLDDVHKLSRVQRRHLVQYLVDYRPSMGVMLGERLEALDSEELLSSGAKAGRDYETPVTVESYWRRSNSKQFERLTGSIARKRAVEARDSRVDAFEENLGCTLEAEDQALADVSSTLIGRLTEEYGDVERYANWLEAVRGEEGSPLEKAKFAKAVELAIQRNENRGQLVFDFAFGVDKLEEMLRPDLLAAAELTMCREFSIPYYYGPSRVARLASSNIEQFLWLAGELFEEMISAALLRNPSVLAPRRQEEILKTAAAQWFANIPREVPRGREVRRFLSAIAKTCEGTTYRAGAPYAPGATAIGIRMSDHELLFDSMSKGNERSPYRILAEVIGTCVANNYLELSLNYKCQNEEWMLLHLNRAVCMLYGLPLQTGDFSKQRVDQIAKWPSLSPHKSGQPNLFGETAR
jgi:hypothetical protein